MPPLKVLILVDKFDYHGTYLNGPSRYFSWVAERLDRDRFTPLVCGLRARGRSDALFKERGIDVLYLGVGKFSPLALTKIIRIIREHEIDILHLTGYGATTFGRIAAAYCRKPAIVQEHWVDPKISRVHRLFERCISLFPSRAIAISGYAKRFLVEKKRISEENIVVIRNGIPLVAFRDASEASGREKRREFGIPDDAPVVGIVGMLHENKGHRYFLEAASRVLARRPRSVFLIVGDGELRGELERRVEGMRLNGRVRFLGHQHDMPALLRMLDIWVMASISETAPLSLLEAMAAGRAIVTTDCGGPGEIVRDGVNGLVVPVRNGEGLGKAIERLIDDPVERAELGRKAQEASEQFDIEKTVAELQDFYTQILGAQVGRGAPRTEHA